MFSLLQEKKLRDLSGSVFQFEVWLNNTEQQELRITSGNAYTVRRALIDKLLNLHEGGWSRRGSGSYDNPQNRAFFDPAEL